MSKSPTPHQAGQPSAETQDASSRPNNALVEARIRREVEQVVGQVVDGKQRMQVVERVTSMMVAEVFRGPLPHPKHLQAYEDTCAGSADRIIEMAETSQRRREDRRDRAQEFEFQDRRLGMILGFAALITMIGSGVLLIIQGQTVIGGSLLGVTAVSGIVGTFVHGRSGAKPKQAEDSRSASTRPEDDQDAAE
jgi:uncharacterized membrane protein